MFGSSLGDLTPSWTVIVGIFAKLDVDYPVVAKQSSSQSISSSSCPVNIIDNSEILKGYVSSKTTSYGINTIFISLLAERSN